MGKLSENIIANYLAYIEKYNPSGEAIVYGNQRITWSELATRVRTIARALVTLGVRKGDTVAFMVHNSPRFFEINYGIQVAGGIPVPVNYRFSGREVAYQVNHSDAVLFFYESIWETSVSQARKELPHVRNLICDGDLIPEGVLSFQDFLDMGTGPDSEIPTSPTDAAAMIYTGGTTGFPKGVLLSYQAHFEMHASLFANLITRIASLDMDFQRLQAISHTIPVPGIRFAIHLTRITLLKKGLKKRQAAKALERVLFHIMTHPKSARFVYKNSLTFMIPSMPLFHDASYQLLILALAMGNIRFVLVPGAHFEPRAVFETIQAEKPIFMANVPVGWKKLVHFPEKGNYDCKSLRLAASGAGRATPEIKKDILETFPNCLVLDMFGQTEMTPVTTFRVDANPDTLKDRSVGQSIVDVKIVDEDGHELPRGEAGEILYRSSTMMMGYYKDKEKTGEVMADGWFKSGDLGYLDEDGEIRLIDRKNECINTGGEKVYPMEVEDVLNEHPDIESACIIGVPDPAWGSTVRAVVVTTPGKTLTGKDIQAFCRGKLAGYKIPKSLILAEQLPLSPVGKVLRSRIREMYGSQDLS